MKRGVIRRLLTLILHSFMPTSHHSHPHIPPKLSTALLPNASNVPALTNSNVEMSNPKLIFHQARRSTTATKESKRRSLVFVVMSMSVSSAKTRLQTFLPIS
jgi:hypothetical protein